MSAGVDCTYELLVESFIPAETTGFQAFTPPQPAKWHCQQKSFTQTKEKEILRSSAA
jgi:hypothetical protein